MRHHIVDTYVHLEDGGGAQAIEVDPTFWPELLSGARPELSRGRTIMGFAFHEPWSTWEMHPSGEEVVLLLSGAATLTLQLEGGDTSVRLERPGEFAIVPQGVWHTADTSVPTSMLFVTAGAGTQHRPRV